MKNKILVLLLLFGSAFTFLFTSSKAQAEFVDYKFVISNSINDYNEEDVKELLLFFNNYVETYNIDSDEKGYYDISHALYGGLNISFNADLFSLDYGLQFLNGYVQDQHVLGLALIDYELNPVFLFGWLQDADMIVVLGAEATYDYELIISSPEWIPEPLFKGLINFIKYTLMELLKSITDMTMSLINNIWDTNLIDINFVVLSDTPIFSGTLNDMLYSVFSIFYVIFAITVVWRLLKKLLRKLFSIVRW